MMLIGLHGFGVVPAKQFGPSLMPSATSYLSPTETVPTTPDTQGERNPGSTVTPDNNTITATPSTSPTYGTGTYSPSPGFYPPPSNSTPPSSTSTPSTTSTDPSAQSPSRTPSDSTPPATTQPLPVASWPPTCPGGSTWDDGSHTCVSDNISAVNVTYSSVSPSAVSSAGPTVIVTAPGAASAPGQLALTKGQKLALWALGIGVLVVGSIAIFRR